MLFSIGQDLNNKSTEFIQPDEISKTVSIAGINHDSIRFLLPDLSFQLLHNESEIILTDPIWMSSEVRLRE